MVPQGHCVGSGVVNPLGLVRRQPHAGGIFAVDDGEVDLLESLQGPQVPLQVPEPRLPHYVPYRQNVIQHSFPPIVRCSALITEYTKKKRD